MKKLIAICALVVLFSMGYAGAGTWTTIDMPGASGTYLTGIDGRNLVGNYTDTTGTHGFLYNGTSWTTLDKPGASDTYLDGIDGRNLVGTYRIGESYHGFLYDGTTWTTLDMPGASKTYAYGMDGSNIVGYYVVGADSHGFLYVIPEPATLLLLGFGAVMVRRYRK
jgi:hypothetical protein